MNQIKTTDPRGLSDEQIRRIAPSVFATEPWDGVSDSYTFIPTAGIVEQMRKSGLVPVTAQQQIVRIPGKRDFAKHMLRFRTAEDVDKYPRVVDGNAHHFFKNKPVIREIQLTNAHDRTSAFHLSAGLFRLLCSNGLCVPEGLVNEIRVRHVSNVHENVIEGSYEIIKEFPKVMAEIEQWRTIQLPHPQQVAFAKAASELRWGDEAPVQPVQLLQARRAEDASPDLWTTFNRVQENMMKGGLRGRTKTNRRMSTRSINSVTEDTKLNKALWTLAEEMAKLAA